MVMDDLYYRVREVVSHQTHNLETTGANPVPGTQVDLAGC